MFQFLKRPFDLNGTSGRREIIGAYCINLIILELACSTSALFWPRQVSRDPILDLLLCLMPVGLWLLAAYSFYCGGLCLIRRFHDLGLSPLYGLLLLVPVLNCVYLYLLFCAKPRVSRKVKTIDFPRTKMSVLAVLCVLWSVGNAIQIMYMPPSAAEVLEDLELVLWTPLAMGLVIGLGYILFKIYTLFRKAPAAPESSYEATEQKLSVYKRLTDQIAEVKADSQLSDKHKENLIGALTAALDGQASVADSLIEAVRKNMTVCKQISAQISEIDSNPELSPEYKAKLITSLDRDLNNHRSFSSAK